jgi:CRP/FNR family transcriptional regulator, nitrogen oxide reductase regulator
MTARKRTPLATERVEPRACTLPRRLGVLHQTPFFANLPAGPISQIRGFFREKGFAAGQTVYTAGDPAISLYVVAVGKVKLVRATETGKTVRRKPGKLSSSGSWAQATFSAASRRSATGSTPIPQ